MKRSKLTKKMFSDLEPSFFEFKKRKEYYKLTIVSEHFKGVRHIKRIQLLLKRTQLFPVVISAYTREEYEAK